MKNIVSNKINNFEQYGFTGDFEGEILKEFDEFYIGWATYTDDSGITPCQWFKKDNRYGFKHGEDRQHNRSLTQLKWYEDKNNIGKLIVAPCGFIKLFTKNDFHNRFSFNDKGISNPIKCYRPATKEDILTLLIKL